MPLNSSKKFGFYELGRVKCESLYNSYVGPVDWGRISTDTNWLEETIPSYNEN